MDIATAKPTPRSAQRPHITGSTWSTRTSPSAPPTTARLPSRPCTASPYARGIGLLVGGTGLYLRTIARGLPLGRGDSDPDLRAQLEARLEADGLEAVVAELRALEPDGAAAIDLRNPRRVVRALERATPHRLGATSRSPEGYPAP